MNTRRASLAALFLSLAPLQAEPVDVSRWVLPDYPPEFFAGKQAAGQDALEFWMQSLHFRENIGREKFRRTTFENLASGDAALVAAANAEIAAGCRKALADIPAFREKGARTMHQWIICALRVPEALTDETRELLLRTLREADLTHPDNDYDNWLEIAGGNGSNVHGHLTPLILGGALLGDTKAEKMAYWGFRRELDHQNTTGDVGEYNLLENHFNGITDWEMIKEHTPDPHLRRMAYMIAERCWINRVLTWSAATGRNTGPGSRMAPSQWFGSDSERFLFATASRRPVWLNLFQKWDGEDPKAFRSSWPLNQTQARLPDLPDYLDPVAWEKQMPHELQAALTHIPHDRHPVLEGEKDADPLAPKKYVNYQTADYTLGSSTGSGVIAPCYVGAVAFWNNSRNPEAPIGSPERFCALYPHYVFNGMSFLDDGDLYFQKKPDEPLSDHRGGPSGPWLREFIEFGRLGTLQHRNTLIASYTSDTATNRDRLVKSKVNRASAGMFLMRWTDGVEGLSINREPVKSLPAELSPGDWWFIEDGDVYAAVRPLEATRLRGKCRTVLEKRTRHIVLYQDNLAGADAEGIPDREWVEARSGFVVEMGNKAEYGSFGAFRDLILAGKVTKDSSEGLEREIAWERQGRKLEMKWNCYTEAFSRRLIDGKEDPWPDFLTAPEFSVGKGTMSVKDATLELPESKTGWLLSAAPMKTWVAYQPEAEESMRLGFRTPVAEVTADSFPFGKIIVKEDGGKIVCHIDASYRPFFHYPPRGSIYQARGTLPSEIVIRTKAVVVEAAINGRPCPVVRDADGVFRLNPYHDPDAMRIDAGFRGISKKRKTADAVEE
ncbi:MAG: hypothetical protein KF712_18455 [Akkermansiaceae bacterium]|nr:hypothetical protein [Akkermansiaceae bacterium]